MIIVRVTMNVLPEKHQEVFQTLVSMIEPAVREKGCLSYDVFCDMKDNHIFSLIEEWDTREDLEHHIRSEIFGVLLGTKSLLAQPSAINIHTISHSEGVEAIEALRGMGTSKKKF